MNKQCTGQIHDIILILHSPATGSFILVILYTHGWANSVANSNHYDAVYSVLELHSKSSNNTFQ